MDARRFSRLKELVAAALELPPEEREAYVLGHCADDAALAHEALALLAHDRDTNTSAITAVLGSRLEKAAAGLIGDGDDHPDRIGAYRILDVLGEGGMGVVYRAQQLEPLRREVALKVIRRGFVGSDAATRFAAESQALAVMDHPHIARVFDVGATESGLPYFTMELVAGQPLTRHCDEQRLDLPARLELFRRVCHAVQHAHQRGIIHRDLKPSNVLVTRVNGRATPKIIDFGIAKDIENLVDDADPFTQAGTLMGTLEYMSPEQAMSDPARIDTRTDIYSLGVLLYELVSGSLPFEPGTLRAAAALETQRILQEVEPPRPSRRLETDAAAAQAAAAARDTEVGALKRQVRGDIDWIVMKALAKNPDRRYQSAHGLALEIDRIQRQEPVSAGPPSIRYRLGKFARRHRVGVFAAGAVAFAILAGAGLAVTGMVRATRAQRQATVEAASTRAINDFLTEMLVAVQPDKARGNEVTVREILDSAAARLDEPDRFGTAPEVEASLYFTIGDTYLTLGDFATAIGYLEHALAIYRRTLAGDDERIPTTIDRIGQAHWFLGDMQVALQSCQEILAFRERTVGTLSPDYSAALSNIGNIYADMQRYEEAESYQRRALAIDRQVLGEDQGDLLAYSLNNLATLLADQERFAEAITLHRESLELRRRFHGEPSPSVLLSLANLGFALDGAGEVDEAETILRLAVADSEQIFGVDHMRTAIAWANLSSPLRKQGRFAEAEDLLRRAHATFGASLGEESWRVGAIRGTLGELMLETGREDAAVRELRLAWDIQAAALGEDSRAARRTAGILAGIYEERDQAFQADAWTSRATAGVPD